MAPGPLKTSLALSTLVLCLVVVAYGTPYWFVSWAKVHNQFQRMGIWEVCFDHFTHPEDSMGREHDGCHWIFNKDYFAFRHWLIPPWLIVVMILSCLGLISACVQFICHLFIYLQSNRPKLTTIIVAGSAMAFTGAAWFAIILIFGLFAWGPYTSWDWMLYPNYCYLSWSYAMACLTVVFGLGDIAMLRRYYKLALKNKPMRPLEKEPQQHVMMPPGSARYPPYGQIWTPGGRPQQMPAPMGGPKPSIPASQAGSQPGSLAGSRAGSVQQLPVSTPMGPPQGAPPDYSSVQGTMGPPARPTGPQPRPSGQYPMGGPPPGHPHYRGPTSGAATPRYGMSGATTPMAYGMSGPQTPGYGMAGPQTPGYGMAGAQTPMGVQSPRGPPSGAVTPRGMLTPSGVRPMLQPSGMLRPALAPPRQQAPPKAPSVTSSGVDI